MYLLSSVYVLCFGQNSYLCLSIGVGGIGSQGAGGASGAGQKVSSNTKGAEYDQTGGAVDDRSGLQKVKDKLTPGSDVGKHSGSNTQGTNQY